MFKLFKPKKTKEELEKERKEKYKKTLEDLDNQLLSIKKQKKYATAKVVEAKQKNLKREEQMARNNLGAFLAQEKRVESMKFQLELAEQKRDLTDVQKRFIECVGDIALEIDKNVSSTNSKTAKKAYTKALLKVEEQNEKVNDVLSVGDYVNTLSVDNSAYEEFDTEIDQMVEDYESKVNIQYPNKNTNV